MRAAHLTLFLGAGACFCVATDHSTAGFAVGGGEDQPLHLEQSAPQPPSPPSLCMLVLADHSFAVRCAVMWLSAPAVPFPGPASSSSSLSREPHFAPRGWCPLAGGGTLCWDSCMEWAAGMCWAAPASFRAAATLPLEQCESRGYSHLQWIPFSWHCRRAVAAGLRLPWEGVKAWAEGGGRGLMVHSLHWRCSWGSSSKQNIPARTVARAGRFPLLPWSLCKPKYCFKSWQQELGCCRQPDLESKGPLGVRGSCFTGEDDMTLSPDWKMAHFEEFSRKFVSHLKLATPDYTKCAGSCSICLLKRSRWLCINAILWSALIFRMQDQ